MLMSSGVRRHLMSRTHKMSHDEAVRYIKASDEPKKLRAPAVRVAVTRSKPRTGRNAPAGLHVLISTCGKSTIPIPRIRVWYSRARAIQLAAQHVIEVPVVETVQEGPDRTTQVVDAYCVWIGSRESGTKHSEKTIMLHRSALEKMLPVVSADTIRVFPTTLTAKDDGHHRPLSYVWTVTWQVFTKHIWPPSNSSSSFCQLMRRGVTCSVYDTSTYGQAIDLVSRVEASPEEPQTLVVEGGKVAKFGGKPPLP